MVLFEWLNKIDTQFFLTLNGANTPFFDHFFSLFTCKEMWYPLYLLLVILILKKYGLKGIWVILFFILAVAASDQLSGVIKNLVQRYRPSHEPSLTGIVNMPAGQGGLYGFVSSHAANSFALTILIGSLAKSKRLWTAFILWALLTCYSRIYVGVHYPLDVIAGAVLGGFIGWGVYLLLKLFDNHFQRKNITMAGHWKPKYSNLVVTAFIFTTVSLLIASKLLLTLA